MGLIFKLKNTLSNFGSIFEKRIAPEQDANGEAAMNEEDDGDGQDRGESNLGREEVRIFIAAS